MKRVLRRTYLADMSRRLLSDGISRGERADALAVLRAAGSVFGPHRVERMTAYWEEPGTLAVRMTRRIDGRQYALVRVLTHEHLRGLRAGLLQHVLAYWRDVWDASIRPYVEAA